MENDNSIPSALYFLYTLQRSQYGLELKWKDIKETVVYLFGEDILEKLKKNDIISTYAGDNLLEVINLNDIGYNIGRQEKEKLFEKIINFFSKDKQIGGLMRIIYLYRKIASVIIDSLNVNITMINPSQESPYFKVAVPLITSNDFYYSNAFADYSQNTLKEVQFDLGDFEEYLQDSWFIRIVILIKDGISGNYGYSKSVENIDANYLSGLLKLISNDYISAIMMHLDIFLNDKKINQALIKNEYKTIRKEKIQRFYDWLAIANDIAVGFEFVIGSILFLPRNDATLGVYLFIIGSSQLLIRPMIQIARKIQIYIIK